MPLCAEKVALLQAFQAATQNYSEAVVELNRLVGTSSDVEFLKMFAAADEQRKIADSARIALSDHVAGHHC